MKKLFIAAAALTFTISFSSCSKCTTCSYTTELGVSAEAESCGSSSDNEDFEADITSQWGSYGTVTCTED